MNTEKGISLDIVLVKKYIYFFNTFFSLYFLLLGISIFFERN